MNGVPSFLPHSPSTAQSPGLPIYSPAINSRPCSSWQQTNHNQVPHKGAVDDDPEIVKRCEELHRRMQNAANSGIVSYLELERVKELIPQIKHDKLLVGDLETAIDGLEKQIPDTEKLQVILRMHASHQRQQSNQLPAMQATPYGSWPVNQQQQNWVNNGTMGTPPTMVSRKQQTEMGIKYLEKRLAERKVVAVKFRNQKNMHDALLVMKEVKSIESQLGMFKMHLGCFTE